MAADDDTLEFRALGPLEVLRGGQPVERGSPMEQTLLALLIMQRNQYVSADELIDGLWGEAPPATAPTTLRSYVSRLRRRLDPFRRPGARTSIIEQRDGAYRLRAEGHVIDSTRLEVAVQEARHALEALDPATAVQHLRKGLALWRGNPYGELGYHPIIGREADRLIELRRDAAELLADAEIALGHVLDAVRRLEDIVDEDPLRERAWTLLVEGLALTGRWTVALKRANTARDALRRELGTEPGHELQSLVDEIRERRLPHRPAYRSSRPPPRPLTRLVARDEELVELIAILAAGGVVTVVGSAGVGKTRLAVELAARRWHEHGPGSVVWVDVTPLADPADLMRAVADAIGVGEPSPGTEWDGLIAALGPEPPVLVLDDCDRLVAACASLVRELLRRSSRLSVLATSREGLGLPGERIVALTPLACPDETTIDPHRIAASPAVQLLVERAAEVRHGFVVTPGNASDLAAIVRRLDGLPLAIDLAAGRLRGLAPADLLPRLADRFRLLSGASGSRLARHVTLHAAIAWGYDLMSTPEQVVFRRLSVFRGSFGLAEAEVVCGGAAVASGDVAGLIGRLVDRSMLVPDSADRVTRFRMLETLRDFAADAASGHEDMEAVRRRHYHAYRNLVEAMQPMLRGRELADGLSRIDADRHNIAAALRWSLDSSTDPRLSLELAGPLWRYWLKRGLVREGLDWLNQALSRAAEAPKASVAMAETAATMLASSLALPEAAIHADRAVQAGRNAGDAHLLAWARIMRALHRARSGAGDAARADVESALAAVDATSDLEGAATGVAALGMASKYEGRLAESRAHFERSLALYEQLGDAWDAGWAFVNLAHVALLEGDASETRNFALEALKRFRAAPDRRAVAAGRLMLAEADVLAGDVVAAEARLAGVLGMARRYGYTSEATAAAEALERLGRPPESAR